MQPEITTDNFQQVLESTLGVLFPQGERGIVQCEQTGFESMFYQFIDVFLFV